MAVEDQLKATKKSTYYSGELIIHRDCPKCETRNEGYRQYCYVCSFDIWEPIRTEKATAERRRRNRVVVSVLLLVIAVIFFGCLICLAVPEIMGFVFRGGF